MHKIVVLDGYTLNPGDISWEALNEFGTFKVYDRTAPEDIIERIGDCDIVLTNKTVLTGDVLRACPNIRYIGCLSTGYNVIDFSASDELGIVVTNIPAYGTEAVAQHTMALLLEIASKVGMHSDAVKEGQWAKSKDFCFWNAPLFELAGKTIGIIGYGAIGQSVGKKAEAFGMNVLPYSRSMSDSGLTMEEIFEKADVITLHCPLTKDNEKMINKDSIAKMKDGVIILNTGRGGLINEVDLKEALDQGKVAGAGLDVVAMEPVTEGYPLFEAKNLWVTPHIAWAAKETRERLFGMAVDNIKAFLNGTPINQVH